MTTQLEDKSIWEGADDLEDLKVVAKVIQTTILLNPRIKMKKG